MNTQVLLGSQDSSQNVYNWDHVPEARSTPRQPKNADSACGSLSDSSCPYYHRCCISPELHTSLPTPAHFRPTDEKNNVTWRIPDPRPSGENFARDNQEGDAGVQAVEETAEARAYLPQTVGARKKNIWEVAEEISPQGNPSISIGYSVLPPNEWTASASSTICRGID